MITRILSLVLIVFLFFSVFRLTIGVNDPIDIPYVVSRLSEIRFDISPIIESFANDEFRVTDTTKKFADFIFNKLGIPSPEDIESQQDAGILYSFLFVVIYAFNDLILTVEGAADFFAAVGSVVTDGWTNVKVFFEIISIMLGFT